MKRISIYFILFTCLAFTACGDSSRNNENNQPQSIVEVDYINSLFAETEIDYSDSDAFSESEINSAINCIGERFKNFPGASMIKIWYDEEKSNSELSTFFGEDEDYAEGVTDENKIILFSDFYVDERGIEGSLNPDCTYEDWMWILSREDKESPWEIWDMGY